MGCWARFPCDQGVSHSPSVNQPLCASGSFAEKCPLTDVLREPLGRMQVSGCFSF